MKKSSKKMNASLKIVIVLVSIALCAGLILGVVNKFTPVDAEAEFKTNVEKLYTDSTVEKTVDVSNYANTEGSSILRACEMKDGAVAIQAHADKCFDGGGLNLLIVIKNGKIVAMDGKGNSETPGLGSKALTPDYLSKFYGKDVTLFLSGIADTTVTVSTPFKQLWDFQTEFPDKEENAPVVEGVSGATKTSGGVRTAVTAAATFYNARYMKA